MVPFALAGAFQVHLTGKPHLDATLAETLRRTLVRVVPAAAGVLALVLILAFRRLDVTVSAAGVTIAYGLKGWPRQHIDITDIVGASVERVGWRSSGGLGYRGNLRLFKQARVLVRHGECLRLDMERGRRLWVSVDEADGAVAALAELGVGN